MHVFQVGYRLSSVICMGLLFSSLRAQTAAVSGESVYGKRCAVCHEQINPRIPHRATLQKMTATRILRSLDFGAMMSIAYPLNREERQAVASYLGVAGKDVPPRAEAFCSDRKVRLADRSEFAWNGWSPGPANMRYQSSA